MEAARFLVLAIIVFREFHFCVGFGICGFMGLSRSPIGPRGLQGCVVRFLELYLLASRPLCFLWLYTPWFRTTVEGLYGVFIFSHFILYLLSVAPSLSLRPLRPPTSTPVLVPMLGGSCTLPGASIHWISATLSDELSLPLRLFRCRSIGPCGLQGGWCDLDLVKIYCWATRSWWKLLYSGACPMLAMAGASLLELLLLLAFELGLPLRFLRCLNGPRGLRG